MKDYMRTLKYVLLQSRKTILYVAGWSVGLTLFYAALGLFEVKSVADICYRLVQLLGKMGFMVVAMYQLMVVDTVKMQVSYGNTRKKAAVGAIFMGLFSSVMIWLLTILVGVIGNLLSGTNQFGSFEVVKQVAMMFLLLSVAELGGLATSTKGRKAYTVFSMIIMSIGLGFIMIGTGSAGASFFSISWPVLLVLVAIGLVVYLVSGCVYCKKLNSLEISM